MSPTAGTAAQLARVTGVAVSTIHAYARDGLITRVGWTVGGTRLAALYDGTEVLRVAGEQAVARWGAPRGLR